MPTGSVIGREAELAAAVAACQGAAAGHGSVLIVVGDPGIGKTALLGAVGPADSGWHLLRSTGVEAEMAVPYATLQALLWPLRDELDELETGQARLLKGVLDLGPAAGATTFAIGAATLALLSNSSREKPTIVIVDDAHWADVGTQEVLCFVGRRLDAERIALLVGVREGEPCLLADERAFARLQLAGLDPDEARMLLDRSSTEGLAPSVREALLRICNGSPLGLIELPRFLSAAQRRGEEPLPAPLAVGRLVQRAFAARASSLDLDARRALVLLAAAGEADVAFLLGVGVTADAVDHVESSGLAYQRAGTLVFGHPLVQAAVYGAATANERREAHRQLASATAGARRAWHLGKAASGPDELVAAALQEAANEARLAGGLIAEAQALERAAELTPDLEVRARRLLGASRAWRRAGRLEHSTSILERAVPLAASVRTRAELQLERGSNLVREGECLAASGLMVEEAERAAPAEPTLAGQMLARAAIAAHVLSDAPGAIAFAERACSLVGAAGDRAELEAVTALVEVRTAAGAPPDEQDFALVRRAAQLLEQPGLRAGSEEVHWIAYCLALHERDDEARRMSDRSLTETRASGDVWNLCYALYARAAIEQASGRLDIARPYASEAVALAEEIGEPWRFNEALAVMSDVEAARGIPEEFQRLQDAKRGYGARDPAREFYVAGGLGTAHLACARFDEAISFLETAARFVHSGPARAWYHLVPLELADAYLGAGKRRAAETVLRDVGPEIDGCLLSRPKAKLARVRALASPDSRYEAAFAEVITMLDEVPNYLERARVELGWGERLRRAGRPEDAAVHLERALVRFKALGAVGWAERTRLELETASGKTRQVQPRRTDVLSAQELRVAQHAAGGMRDREIAAALYLSPRTVEFHLQQAYRKLDVSNRTQLAAVLAGDDVRPITQVSEPVPKVQ
jgi:DNA-binding CsgD family transcriptional regulator